MRLWDPATGQSLGSLLTGEMGGVDSVALSPDGHWVVAGSDDKTVRVWDVDSGEPVGAPLTGHTEPVLWCGVQS